MEAPMSPVPMTTATSGSPAMVLAVSSSAADAVMVTAQDSVVLAVDRQPDSARYRRSAAVALPSQSVLVAAWAAARDPDLVEDRHFQCVHSKRSGLAIAATVGAKRPNGKSGRRGKP